MSSELSGPLSYSGDPWFEDTFEPLEPRGLELSVVMPCLDEERSVGICVRKAKAGIAATGMTGEVIVVDNGSTDCSVEVAEDAGAVVIHQPERGYGNACIAGFNAAKGRIIVFGDADDSYDFTMIPALIQPISEGFEYVLGSRFAGDIQAGAMTWSHRQIGNPGLTSLLNLLYGLKISDAHSGFRAFTRPALDKLGLESPGMELASEIVVKAARSNLRVAEVPITYRPRIGESKLNSFRDGMRHLRFLARHAFGKKHSKVPVPTEYASAYARPAGGSTSERPGVLPLTLRTEFEGGDLD